MTAFSESDKIQLKQMGISRDKVRAQIEIFKKGIPFIELDRAAVVSDGILRFSEEEKGAMRTAFDKNIAGRKLLKFVPASGAASRMFKALFGFLDSFDPKEQRLDVYLSKDENKALKVFFEGLNDFPFYEIVRNRIKGEAKSREQEAYLFVKEMLDEDRLNYGFYPKGLLPFHKYENRTATPFEEHLKEAALYAKVGEDAHLHFTISEQHGELFNEEFSNIKERVSNSTRTAFHVSYSYQKPSTDTVAVTLDNEPFRNDDDTLLFRPGGHGALIENLAEQDADLIFIQNIDNVVVPHHLGEVSNSKKVLGGLLIQIQDQAHNYARKLEKGDLDGEGLNEITSFMQDRMNVRLPDSFSSLSLGQQMEVLKDKINRPIRVCGMVKNEGEPGGGPFWVKDSHGNVSLQIVESAQVNMEQAAQKNIFRDATHFNPVDVVCGIRDHRGKRFNLLNYVDSKQGFITRKTKEGKDLKALELPGLWNGGMAFWNTVFVEVPSATFNPVKTVNDLLKPAHQVK